MICVDGHATTSNIQKTIRLHPHRDADCDCDHWHRISFLEKQKKAPLDYLKNPKTIIQGNLKYAREHYNNVERSARTEDRIIENSNGESGVAEVGEKEEQKEGLGL